jgi:hypothetical protein
VHAALVTQASRDAAYANILASESYEGAFGQGRDVEAHGE